MHTPLTNALILGKWTLLDPQMIELFTRTGLIHLFSASGFHMVCALSMAKLIDFALFKLKVQHPLISLFNLFLFGFFFGFYTGWSSPMVRAYSFSLVLALALHLNISASIFWIFLVSLLLSYFFGKSSELSIYLSGLGMAGILLFRKNKILACFAPWIFSVPLIIFYFQQFSLTAPFYNLLFSPLIAVFVMPLAIIGVYEQLIVPQSNFFFSISELIFKTIVKWLFFFEEHFSYFYYVSPKKFFLFFLMGTISYLSIYQLIKNRLFSLIWSFMLTLCLAFFLKLKPTSISVFNIGQGDSILITTQSNEKVLFDIGPPGYKNWSPKIYRELKSSANYKIDHLIITHFDRDHYGDLSFFFSHFKVNKNAWISELSLNDTRATQIIDIFYQWNISVEILTEKNSPKNLRCFLIESNSRNNMSPACHVSLKKGKSIWMMGDLDQYAEIQFMQKNINLKSDYIKIGHHGSKSSSSNAWLKNTRAKTALISVGKNNYGHPHPDVIHRLKKLNFEIMRTDESGSIHIF
ncbi:MAG: ComEC/Rec2 family competence protein [Oligoflexia bacterium]|nr:ComEC/Rec2 family competence protein [Oligoflexia bacterium]